jgi:signal transduction histidine kinase
MKHVEERMLTALGGMSRHLADDADLRSFFAELTASIADLVGASRVVFWRLDETTATIAPEPGAFGLSDEQVAALGGTPCQPAGDHALERVVFDGVVVRGEVGEDSRLAGWRPLVRRLRRRDLLVIPWTAGGHRLGALSAFGSTAAAGFHEDDIWVLRAAATAAAMIFEHRQADQALRESREGEAANLRQRIEQSIQLEQLKADFLRLASHELRAPLAIVRGYLSMIGDGTLGAVDEGVAQAVPLMAAKLEEMNQLVNEMLETARLEDSALQLRVATLDVRDVVREAVGALEPLTGERHRLVLSTPVEPVSVHGDRARLAMIVTNLVHNAIKYSPDGGVIRVVCAAAGRTARVSVSDEGVGIAPADRDRLFTRFGRIVTERTTGISGTGLGLYLARDLARRHGGDVDVVSEPGRGSTFTLTLPVTAAA